MLSPAALGSVTVVPTTVMPESSAARAKALAKSASVRKELSLEWPSASCPSSLDLTLLVSTAAESLPWPDQSASMEPNEEGREVDDA